MKFLVVSEGWEYFNTFTNKWGFGNSYLVITSLVKLSVCVCVCVCVCVFVLGEDIYCMPTEIGS